MKRRFRWQVYVAALALSVGLALGLSELTLRGFGISYPVFWVADADLGISLRPGAEGWFRGEGGAPVAINAHGMRDVPRELAKAPGVYRIAVLGDSFVEGLQVPQEKTGTAVLERLLGQGKRPVEVLNFGCSGYGTGQELIALGRAAAFEPDLVLVVVLTGNDLADNERELDPLRRRPYWVWQGDELVLDSSFRESAYFKKRQNVVMDFLAAHCRVFQLVNALRGSGASPRRELGRPPPDAPRVKPSMAAAAPVVPRQPGLDDLIYVPPPDEQWKRMWRTTERLLVKMNEAATASKARFGVVLCTNGIDVYPDAAARAAYAASIGAPDLDYPSKHLEAFLRGAGIPVLDLTPPFRAHADRTGAYLHGFAGSSPGTGHWNEQGHRLFAETAAPWIVRAFAP